MSTPWRPQIKIIQDGEQVNACVANRPIKELSDQTEYLKEQVSNLDPASGRIIFANASLDSSVNKGNFVYYNSSTGTFFPALAANEIGLSGQYTVTPSSYVVGLVVSKSSSTIGNILSIGQFSLSEFSLDPNLLVEDSSDVPFSEGRYYLSRTTPGRMTLVPNAPSVQLGYFTTTKCFVSPLQKDLFESHFHYRIPILSIPSASQNYTQKGWANLTYGDATTSQYIDYFNRGTATSPPAIILCVRNNGSGNISPTRIDIYKATDGRLGITLNGGAIYTTPLVAGSTVNILATIAWPSYGAWTTVPGTNVDIAFIRSDDNYSNPLSTDVVSSLTALTDQYKVYLPNDLSGWTNVNPFDPATPSGVGYSYLIQNQENLNDVFPPIPASSGILEENGTTLDYSDFVVTEFGIYWVNTATGYSPWPIDYSVLGGMDLSNARNLIFNFTKAALGNADPVVLSLHGVAPILVTRCPSGNKASTGNLQISIDLNLLISAAAPIDSTTGLVSVSGQNFTLGNMVSRLLPGNGIAITNPVGGGPANTGALTITATNPNFEGEVDDILLRNAKDVDFNGFPYIAFPVPTTPSGISFTAKMPNVGFNPNISLNFYGQFFGETSVSGTTANQQAVFQVAIYVVRPGFSLASLNTTTAIVIQNWLIPFNTSYTAMRLLTNEYPFIIGQPATGANTFSITPALLLTAPGSTSAAAAGFLPGDLFVVQIDRIRQNLITSQTDTYNGRVGVAGLRWILN